MATPSNAMDPSKKLFATAASVVASGMLVRSVVNDLLPNELRGFLNAWIDALWGRLRPERHAIVVDRKEGYEINLLYEAIDIYLSTRVDCRARRLRASRVEGDEAMAVSLDYGQEMVDVYEGVEFGWKLVCKDKDDRPETERKKRTSFELSFDAKHADKALNDYLPFIAAKGQTVKHANRTLKLFMNDGTSWESIKLCHPSTFDTLAVEEDLKRSVMDDLARFLKRKDYYRRTGKAWKRGYLLHGPPGTGKSSLVAAMANYLKFDIYDLELSQVKRNSTLRHLLVAMSNRSILLVEDIDCAIDLPNREDNVRPDHDSSCDDKVDERSTSKITLSGLLNFVDGLWSASGEERIIIFTTNYKDRLDPALLRPGRMDVHIHMGFCKPRAFRRLASNYHSVDDGHELFPVIERLLQEVQVTPADVAGELMKSDDADDALRGLVEFLQSKRREAREAIEFECNEERTDQDTADEAAAAAAA